MSDKDTPEEASQPLGQLLKQAREILGLSVRGAAAQADISGAYLSQLEADTIKEPSPHILYKLANVYHLSYANLMRAAGYMVPEREETSKHPETSSPFDIVLRSASPLTQAEREALAEYLAWYRSRHGQPPERR